MVHINAGCGSYSLYLISPNVATKACLLSSPKSLDIVMTCKLVKILTTFRGC